MKTFFLVTLSIFLTINLFAGKISKKDAERVARNFYYESANRHKSLNYDKIQTVSVDVFKMKSQEMYYVVNMSDKGYVLVSAEDATYPILGYSYEGSFDKDNMNPSVKSWMEGYCKEIDFARKSKLAPDAETTRLWSRLLTTDPSKLVINKGAKDVAPKLLSIWNQDAPYNELCPADAASPAGYGGHVPVGCTATSMSQVMYYFRYPLHGVGSHSYYHNTYGTLSADFAAATYDYSQMLNNNTASNLALSTLAFHCGVSVEMDYAPTGSGADTYAAMLQLVSVFKFSNDAAYYLKGGHQYTGTWPNLLEASLDQDYLIIYSGFSNADGGHAWVCDGYEATDHFHFNWGWEGAYNGFYYVGALNPGTSDFNSGNGAALNLHPGTGYPYYCNGTTTLTSLYGSFEDGSGPTNYHDNGDCRWLIQPTDSVKKITLNFSAFDIADTNDKIIVYDGNDITAPVIATITGSDIPNSISVNNSKMLVRFITNSSANSAGWQAYYSCTPFIYCSGLTALNAPSGTITDGSMGKNYSNNSNCKWLINPAGAHSISFTFTSIDTEAGRDTISFKDPMHGTSLGTFSGSTIPQTIVSPSAQMLISFKSNSSNTGSGWEGNYAAEVGVNENEYMDNLSIYPNPATTTVNVSFNLSNSQNMNLRLTDMAGKVVFSQQYDNLKGAFNKDIDVSAYSKGVYFLKLISSEGNITQKIVLQ